MTPRRLIPYAVIFLILAGTYVGLRWQQASQETRAQQGKQVFTFPEKEITALTLKRGKEEVQLTRPGSLWEMTKPVQARTDPETVGFLVKTLADLKKDRDLGPGEAKTFGLGEAGLSISFTAKGEQHRLVVGDAVPGGRGHYARKDDDPDIFTISAGAREALNQQANSLRDKTLWAFAPDQVKAIKIRTDKAAADLEKTDAGVWRWPGKANFKVRSDRVEALLRQLETAQVMEFPAAEPKDLRAVGLVPQAQITVTLTTPQGSKTLFLGAGIGAAIYARLGDRGQVVKVHKDLAEQIARIVPNLEDRRLWAGSGAEVAKVIWGVPGQTWTAVKAEKQWQTTGPGQTAARPALPGFQMAIGKFQNLDYSSQLPQTGAGGKASYLVEFLGPGDQPLFRLEQVGKKGETEVIVRTKSGETTGAAVILQKDFLVWQQEMDRLRQVPPTPGK